MGLPLVHHVGRAAHKRKVLHLRAPRGEEGVYVKCILYILPAVCNGIHLTEYNMLTAVDLEKRLDTYEEKLEHYRKELKFIRREFGKQSHEEQQWRVKEKSLARNVELLEGIVEVTHKNLKILFPENAERRGRNRANSTRMSTRIGVFSNVQNMWHTWFRSRRDGYIMLTDPSPDS